MSLPKACAPAWPRLAWSTSWPPTAHFRRFSREEAGFSGLWAFGFELSKPYELLQDMNLISMTQHLDMLQAIAGRTSCRSSRTLIRAMARRLTSFNGI